jgi:hypothetical protein
MICSSPAGPKGGQLRVDACAIDAGDGGMFDYVSRAGRSAVLNVSLVDEPKRSIASFTRPRAGRELVNPQQAKTAPAPLPPPEVVSIVTTGARSNTMAECWAKLNR